MKNFWTDTEEIDVIVNYADDLSITEVVKSKVSRRDFLKTAVVTTGALLVPIVIEPVIEPKPEVIKFKKAIYIAPNDILTNKECTIVNHCGTWCDVVFGEVIEERIYPDWPVSYQNTITVEREYLRIT